MRMPVHINVGDNASHGRQNSDDSAILESAECVRVFMQDWPHQKERATLKVTDTQLAALELPRSRRKEGEGTGPNANLHYGLHPTPEPRRQHRAA
jgi:hypothetical protein